MVLLGSYLLWSNHSPITPQTEMSKFQNGTRPIHARMAGECANTRTTHEIQIRPENFQGNLPGTQAENKSLSMECNVHWPWVENYLELM